MINLPAEGDVLAGKYRVERVIGRGGMGVVVAAWHLELDHHVALKFLLPDLAERGDAAERFRREARAAAKIKSEHVARVFDVGNFDGAVPYMVMELLEGRDMGDELRKRGPLPVQEAVDYMIEAIEAVAEAHALGIVHRDLKPENIFLAQRSDGTRIVKVLDFGISKTMVLSSGEERSLTQTSTIMGSPLYMSPEQMRAPRDVDGRSDVWALGVILYELLSGRPPFMADSIPQLCAMLVESTPAPLRELRPDVPEGIELVVARCLAKPVSARWPSVGELARALLPFASATSHVHAARASRMKNTTELVVGIAPGTLASGSPPHAPAPLELVEPVRATPAGSAISTMPAPAESAEAVVHPTQESWGHTPAPGPARKRRSWMMVGALLVAGLLAALWVARKETPGSGAAREASVPAPESPVGMASPTVLPASPASEAAGSLPTTLPSARGTPEQGVSAASAPAPVAPAPAPPGSSPATPTGSAAALKAPERPSLKDDKRRPVSVPSAKQSGAVDLTDFGGRR